jgi:hypothetical protein
VRSATEAVSHAAAIRATGWTLIEYPADEPLLDFARALGEPVAARVGSPLPEVLVPTSPDMALPRSLSAVYGLGVFPFHTDAAHHALPPDMITMRLAPESVSWTSTLVVDSWSFLGEDVARFQGGSWLISAGRQRFYASILVRRGSRHLLRFDPGCMKPVSTRAEEVHSALLSAIGAAVPAEIRWRRNEVLLMNNWRCLHGRTAVGAPGRALERVLIRSA